jgi:beta-glucosidase
MVTRRDVPERATDRPVSPTADVPVGCSARVVVRTDPRMWRRWDAAAGGWSALEGGELLVARGLGDVRLRLPLDQP